MSEEELKIVEVKGDIELVQKHGETVTEFYRSVIETMEADGATLDDFLLLAFNMATHTMAHALVISKSVSDKADPGALAQSIYDQALEKAIIRLGALAQENDNA